MNPMPTIKIRMPLRRLQQVRGEVVMDRTVTPVVEEMVSELRARAHWPDVAAGYQLESHAFYNRQYYGISNTEQKLFALEEYGASPHDILQPPHVIPGYKMRDWMGAYAVPASLYFYIQFIKHAPPYGYWTTHNPGFEGDHIARDTYAEYRPLVEEAVVKAVAEILQPVGYLEFG